MTTNSIQKNIMRRVYYSFMLSIVSHSMFWQGMFLGVAAVLLARWLHVASIVHNFLSVPVETIPQYVMGSFWGAITHGEFLTAVILVLTGIVTVSCGYRIAHALMPQIHFSFKI